MIIKQVQALDLGDKYKVPFSDLGHLVSTLLSNVYAIMAVVFLVLIIIAGWGMIVGAGKGEGGKVQEGGKAVSAAIIGFVFIFLSFLIVRVIEVITGAEILDPSSQM